MLGYVASTNFTITLASLASGSARESAGITAVVGGTGYDDFMLQLQLGIATPTSAGDKAIYLWFAGSADGTNYTEPATGADAAITIGTNHNLFGPFEVSVVVGTQQYDVCVPSLSRIFGGMIPKKWSLIVENQAGGALNGTEFDKWYTPVFFTT